MNIQLAPEIEAGLRAEAAARGVDVEALVASAVKAYLREPGAAIPAALRVRTAEMAWAAHPDERFAGRWVVLQGSRVVDCGSDPKQLYNAARAKGDASPFLIFVSPGEHEPFAGGWID